MNISFFFDEVEDFRVVGRCKHLLSDILGLILLGSLADCNDFSEIQDYGEDNIEELRNHFGFIFSNGIPSGDTLERVMRYINPKELESCYHACYKDIKLQGKHLCIDGKELRGTIKSGKKKAEVQMVNIWIDELGLSFGQEQIETKSNEIKAIPNLLDKIDCKGSIITIDAIACQKTIIDKIIAKQADYLIAVKANQKTLLEQIITQFDRCKSIIKQQTFINKEHGRGECRKVFVLEDLMFIDELENWQGVQTIIKLERERILPNQKKETSTAFFFSSLSGLTPDLAGQFVRNHWSIENRLHWQLDFTFKEDDSRVRRDKSPANLHIIRKWSLNILKNDPDKISLKRKRKKARKFDYLVQIITADKF